MIPQEEIKKVKSAKNTISRFTKALLTEKPKRDEETGDLIYKSTIGQSLRVATRGKKLVSQKKPTAAKEGYENRKAYLQKAKEYEDIMPKKR